MAALVISIVALLVSGTSVWYARSQAHMAKARRHDEESPELIGSCDLLDGGTYVTFTNRRPIDLDNVAWEVVVDVARSPLLGLDGDRASDHGHRGELGPLKVGKSKTLHATVDPGNFGGPPEGEVTFRCLARRGDEEWPVSVVVKVARYEPPRKPMVRWR